MPLPTITGDPLGYWATNAGVTLEPSSGYKEAGFVVSGRPPARVVNWLLNKLMRTARQAYLNPLRSVDLHDYSSPAPGPLVRMLNHPSDRYCYGVNGGGGSVFASDTDGFQWYTDSVTGGSNLRYLGLNSTYLFTVDPATGTLYYKTVYPGSVAWNSTATVANFGRACASDWGYTDSVYVIGGSTTLSLRRATSITGAWSTPTMPVIWTGTAGVVMDVLHLYTDYWAAVGRRTSDGAAVFIISADQGVTWTAPATGIVTVSGITFGFVSTIYGGTACSADSGRIVMVGEDSATSDFAIIYSDDLGTTWTQATINHSAADASANGAMYNVYYCGHGVWIATGSTVTLLGSSASFVNMRISLDDGETWEQVHVRDDQGIVSAVEPGLCVINNRVAFSSNADDVYLSDPVSEIV